MDGCLTRRATDPIQGGESQQERLLKVKMDQSTLVRLSKCMNWVCTTNVHFCAEALVLQRDSIQVSNENEHGDFKCDVSFNLRKSFSEQ